ncbi:hypothetical protein K438DRAFT_1800993 [Mycena galopus ATCC 62051]|nr:hypothetical protein K438DRAFT_1800993 [Mycena galopus ATCC 62051]
MFFKFLLCALTLAVSFTGTFALNIAGLSIPITARDSDEVVPPRLAIYLVLALIAAGVGFLFLTWLFIAHLWRKCRRRTVRKGPSSIEAGLQVGAVSGVSGAMSTSTDNLVEKGAPRAELGGWTPGAP